MKNLFDLTVEDLTATPVWRYEGGSGVEAIVTPDTRDSLTQADEDVFLAATDFTLPDSSGRLGFCFPVDDAGFDYLQPVIVTPTGHVRFWFDGAVAPEVLASQWRALGRPESEVFPLTFRCRVLVDGRTVGGVIPCVEISEAVGTGVAAGPAAAGWRAAEPVPAPARFSRVRRVFETQTGGPEKRLLPRRPAEMLVEFREGDSLGAGVTSNLSRRGMFIRSAELPRFGPALSLTMHLPGGRTVLLKGRVVREGSPPGAPRPAGFGFELTERADEYEAFLARLLDPSR